MKDRIGPGEHEMFLYRHLILYQGTTDERGLSARALALYIHAWHNQVIL